MGKKSKKRLKPKAETGSKSAREEDSRASLAAAQNDDGPGNDFGGLPDRDLKKNLGGCG